MADVSRAHNHPLAHIGWIRRSSREVVDVSLRRGGDFSFVDVRCFAVRRQDRVPTARGVAIAVADLRALRKLLDEADLEAVRLGLLPEGGA